MMHMNPGAQDPHIRGWIVKLTTLKKGVQSSNVYGPELTKIMARYLSAPGLYTLRSGRQLSCS